MPNRFPRRDLIRGAAALGAGRVLSGIPFEAAPSERVRPESVALETYVRRSFNYYNRMVDQAGQPYFNIFWTTPAEAAHDWPDFGDVPSRQLQAVIMGRRMTGERCPHESTWLRRILGCIDQDVALHGNHCRDTRLGQLRTNGLQHIPITFPGTLAGSQHHQARLLLQFFQTRHQLAGGSDGRAAILRLQPDARLVDA